MTKHFWRDSRIDSRQNVAIIFFARHFQGKWNSRDKGCPLSYRLGERCFWAKMRIQRGYYWQNSLTCQPKRFHEGLALNFKAVKEISLKLRSYSLHVIVHSSILCSIVFNENTSIKKKFLWIQVSVLKLIKITASPPKV